MRDVLAQIERNHRRFKKGRPVRRRRDNKRPRVWRPPSEELEQIARRELRKGRR